VCAGAAAAPWLPLPGAAASTVLLPAQELLPAPLPALDKLQIHCLPATAVL